jgi:RNA polymerase sigma factor (TIGR02999 family)
MDENDVTRLLEEARGGDRAAVDALLAQVYGEMRRLAHAQLRNERAGHTLGTTGLVHEAYLKLVDHRKHDWQNRAHFFGGAARAMRRILVDYAHIRQAKKRQGQHVSLIHAGGEENGQVLSLDQLIELDDALQRLGVLNDRVVQVIECRYFAGLTIKETAEALGLSTTTVTEEWKLARAWLQQELMA